MSFKLGLCVIKTLDCLVSTKFIYPRLDSFKEQQDGLWLPHLKLKVRVQLLRVSCCSRLGGGGRGCYVSY